MNSSANATDYYRSILNAMPVPVFVVDGDVRFLDCNEAGAKLLRTDRAEVLHQRGGDVLHCLHSLESPGGCGHAQHCPDCVLRKSVSIAIGGAQVRQHKTMMELLTPTGVVKIAMLVTAAPLEIAGQRRVLLILEDITELLALREIIPICSNCKSIRDDQQYWQKLESYLHDHLRLDFSHGLCPKCAQELFPNQVREPAGQPRSPRPDT